MVDTSTAPALNTDPSHLAIGVSTLWLRTVLLSVESNNRKIAGARRYGLSDCGALHRGGTVPQCARHRKTEARAELCA